MNVVEKLVGNSFFAFLLVIDILLIVIFLVILIYAIKLFFFGTSGYYYYNINENARFERRERSFKLFLFSFMIFITWIIVTVMLISSKQ